VWFCKHLKYCGTLDNEELALALVGPDEPASEPDDELTGSSGGVRKYTRRGAGGENYYRDSAERLRITGTRKYR
jgi:hypothetical protein